MVNVKEILDEFKRIQKAMSDFKMIENGIYKYNRADTVNMNYNEMNEFRHIAAGAYFTSIGHPDYIVDFFGHTKEIKDFLRDFNRFYTNFKLDSYFDIQNNKKGIEIGKKFRYVNKKVLFNYIFKTEIEPKRKKLPK